MPAAVGLVPPGVDPVVRARAADYARAAVSPNTERSYRTAWGDFTRRCETADLTPLPACAATIGSYLAARAGPLAVATLGHRMAAVSAVHSLHGLHLDLRAPRIRTAMRGVRKAHGAGQRRSGPPRCA